MQYVTRLGITSHHLPTALPFIGNFYNRLRASSVARETFVVVGPDHFEQCSGVATTSDMAYKTPYGTLPTNHELVVELSQLSSVNLENECLDHEHSIGVHAAFIKYLYPNAKIVALTLSADTPDAVLQEIASFLSEEIENITIIGSIDFSHYQNTTQANLLDDVSQQIILSMDASGIKLIHADSPPSVKLLVETAKKSGFLQPRVFERANSADFTGNRDNTTGYLNVVFVKSAAFVSYTAQRSADQTH